MKRYLLLTAFSALLFAACEKDEPTTEAYSTDNLTLTQQTKAMLFTGSDPGLATSALYEWFRLDAENAFGSSLNHMVPITDGSHPLYNSISDSLLLQFGLSESPFYFLNYEEVANWTTLNDDIDESLVKKPIAAVGHSVSTNDTSYIVDVKVKFFVDTTATIYAETYMLADIPAKNYPELGEDLRHAATPNLIANSDEKSTWDTKITSSTDSNKVLINKGADFVYQNVLLDNSSYPNFLSTELSEYWPFGSSYTINDEIGYRSTPIRHYFLKPHLRPDFDYDVRSVRFVTIVWIVNEITNSYEYVNSYMN